MFKHHVLKHIHKKYRKQHMLNICQNHVRMRTMYVCCVYQMYICIWCMYYLFVLYVCIICRGPCESKAAYKVPSPKQTHPKCFKSCFVRRCCRTAAVTSLLSAMTDCKLPDPVILTGSGSLHSVIGLRSKVTTVARQRRRLRIKRYFVGGDDHLMGSGCGR